MRGDQAVHCEVLDLTEKGMLIQTADFPAVTPRHKKSTVACGSGSLQGVRAMSDRPTRAQRRRHKNGFRDFPIRGAKPSGVVCMDLDAIRTLCGECDRKGYQLLILPRDRSISDSGLVEGDKRFHRIGREIR
jgi:hypothetical protein